MLTASLFEVFGTIYIVCPLLFITFFLIVTQIMDHISVLIDGLVKVADDQAWSPERKINIMVRGSDTNLWLNKRTKDLLKIVKLFNQLFGAFLFTEIGVCMLNLTSTAFLLYSSFENLVNNPELTGLDWGHDLHHIALPSVFALRFIMLMVNGEILTRRVRKLRKTLMQANVNQIQNKDSYALDSSIEELTNMKIRPLNGFEMCLATFLSCIALLLTYIVILFQFRDEELNCQ